MTTPDMEVLIAGPLGPELARTRLTYPPELLPRARWSGDGVGEAGTETARLARRRLEGEPPRDELDPEVLY